MDESDYEYPTPQVEIRIRAESESGDADADDQVVTQEDPGAPLADTEALSDIEDAYVDKPHEESENVFDRVTSPDLPEPPAGTSDLQQQQEQVEEGPEIEAPLPEPIEAGDMNEELNGGVPGYTPPCTPPAEYSPIRTPTSDTSLPPPPSQSQEFVQESSEVIDNNCSAADTEVQGETPYNTLFEASDFDVFETQFSGAPQQTSDPPPQETSGDDDLGANLVNFLMGSSAEADTAVPDTTKMTIKLPGKPDRPKSPKSPKRPAPPGSKKGDTAESWLQFDDGPASAPDGDENNKGSTDKKVPPPSRPPPPSKSKQPPPKPAPPKFTPGKPSRPPAPGGWETFDGSGTKGTPPKRPSKPPGPLRDEGDPYLQKDIAMSSFDDEAALCDPASPEEKKSKSKVGLLSPKKSKAAKEPKESKKGKSGKKDKKEKKRPEELQRFLKDDGGDSGSKDTDEWKRFQEMQDRISDSVSKTKTTLNKMETEYGDDLEKLTTSAQNSPWTIYGSPDPEKESAKSTTTPVKAGWEGFDDDFSVTPNLELDKQLSHLKVTPVPSPHHTPGPPHNSRRGSGEEKVNGEVDLLGLSASDPVPELKPVPSAGASDLLGLDSDVSASTDVKEITSPPSTLTHDLASLSLDEPMTESEKLAESTSKDTSDSNVEPSQTSIALVDEFLGIRCDVAPPKPTDPMDMLATMKAAKEAVTKAEAAKAEARDAFGLQDDFADSTGEGTGLEDFLGPPPEKTKTPVSGDLFEVEITAETAKDGDVFVVDTEKLKQMVAPPPTKAEIRELNIGSDDMLSPMSDEFDPRADISEEKLTAKPVEDKVSVAWNKPIARKRPQNPFLGAGESASGVKLPMPPSAPPKDAAPDASASSGGSTNPFSSLVDVPAASKSTINPFADIVDSTSVASDTVCEDTGLEILDDSISAAAAVTGNTAALPDNFNPFATITDTDSVTSTTVTTTATSAAPVTVATAGHDDAFDPFQTIQGEDAFVANFPSTDDDLDGNTSNDDATSPRFNPFDKEPPLDEKFANFESKTKAEGEDSDNTTKQSSESSFEEPEEDLEALESFHPKCEDDAWNLIVRQPMKKKLTQNRFWKPVFLRIAVNNKTPTLKIYHNDKEKDTFHELVLQPSYAVHDMGLQQYDQFGKCHTLKLQYVFYRERVGVKAERITPTLSDLTRVRDLKGLKDLVHKPKTTMLLDHAPQSSELIKFASLEYTVFQQFYWALEDALFRMPTTRDKSQTYTKDEITVDVVDEYVVHLDREGHIIYHKARVRVFCLAFLTGMPRVELGMNDKKRRGKEVVGRHDIIPIKTEEWIQIEYPEFHSCVDLEEYDKNRLIRMNPIDACHFEMMRFRVRPRLNKELPLQIRLQMSVIDRKVEIRSEIMIPGYYSNSRKAAQTPCEDIQVRFPIPEPWIYYFRVEKRFRYGAVKSSTRKPGKIKGFERLTMIAQGMMPPSLIEVSTGTAKYEHLFHSVVWRISRLPERNEGAYKTHLLILKLDLGAHDPFPDSYAKFAHVEYQMPNSTVSRAQVRSISVDSEEPPDKWVHHLAKYEYEVEIEMIDKDTKAAESAASQDLVSPTSPVNAQDAAGSGSQEADAEDSSDDSSDSD